MASPEIALLLELVLDLKKDITSLKEETTRNTGTLEDHARRSTASEERHKVTEARLIMLEKREWMINGFFKISLGLLGVIGSAVTIYAAIRHL